MKLWSRRRKNTERIEKALRLVREGRLDEGALAFRRVAGATAAHAVPSPERDPVATGAFAIVRSR